MQIDYFLCINAMLIRTNNEKLMQNSEMIGRKVLKKIIKIVT